MIKGELMASKKGSKKKKAVSSSEGSKVHTNTTATLLAFANPPLATDAQPVARECVSAGLSTIGISGPHQPGDLIDFGAIDRDSCIDFANAIELCVDQHGFIVPALSGTFVIMHEQGTVITFANLVRAIAELMTSKA